MERYRHTQPGTPIRVALVAFLAGAVLAVALDAPLPAALVPALPSAILFLFHALTVDVGGGRVELRFGPGLIRKRIALADVAEATVVRNRWWYGWGIRWFPGGWLWSVSGLDAVELTYTDGRRFRIGTDEPEALCTALRARR